MNNSMCLRQWLSKSLRRTACVRLLLLLQLLVLLPGWWLSLLLRGVPRGRLQTVTNLVIVVLLVLIDSTIIQKLLLSVLLHLAGVLGHIFDLEVPSILVIVSLLLRSLIFIRFLRSSSAVVSAILPSGCTTKFTSYNLLILLIITDFFNGDLIHLIQLIVELLAARLLLKLLIWTKRILLSLWLNPLSLVLIILDLLLINLLIRIFPSKESSLSVITHYSTIFKDRGTSLLRCGALWLGK